MTENNTATPPVCPKKSDCIHSAWLEKRGIKGCQKPEPTACFRFDPTVEIPAYANLDRNNPMPQTRHEVKIVYSSGNGS